MFFFWCKDTMFFASTVGISPKGVGENPYFLYARHEHCLMGASP